MIGQDEEQTEAEIYIDWFEFVDSLGNSFVAETVNGEACNLGKLSVAFITEVSGEDFALLKTSYNGTVTVVSEKPEKDGYVFVGWATDCGDGIVIYNGGEGIECSQDLYFYAVWEKAEETESVEESVVNNGNANTGCSASANGDGMVLEVLIMLCAVVVLRKKLIKSSTL